MAGMATSGGIAAETIVYDFDRETNRERWWAWVRRGRSNPTIIVQKRFNLLISRFFFELDGSFFLFLFISYRKFDRKNFSPRKKQSSRSGISFYILELYVECVIARVQCVNYLIIIKFPFKSLKKFFYLDIKQRK